MTPLTFNCDTSDTVHWSWHLMLLYARMDVLIGEKVNSFRPVDAVQIQIIPTLNIQRDRVCTLIHDDVCISKCMYI